MNKFYFFEGNIYKTEEEVKLASKNYKIKIIDEIKTYKSFEEFQEDYEIAKNEGCSCIEAIEDAR